MHFKIGINFWQSFPKQAIVMIDKTNTIQFFMKTAFQSFLMDIYAEKDSCLSIIIYHRIKYIVLFGDSL